MDILKSVFGASTAAVITVTFIHPIDVVKTRLQISGLSEGRNYKALGVFGTVKVIAKEEGVKSFWKGIQAAYMREASYSGLRIGLYGPIKHFLGVKSNSSFFLKFLSGSLAGAIGSLVGNPFDVMKTRMMASEKKVEPVGKIFKKIVDEFGIKGLYKGLQANVMRACVLNGTKMGTYDQMKHLLYSKKIIKQKGILLETVSAFSSGFFMTCTVAPFDKIRSLLMNQKAGKGIQYNGFIDCLAKTVKAQGPLGLWAGFVPIWARFAPTTTLQLVIFSFMKKWFGISEI